MPDDDPEQYRPHLKAAMDAARAALRERGLEPVSGALFLKLPDGLRLGAHFPEGDLLDASDLAAEGAHAFSVEAALQAIREPRDD